MPDEVFDTYIKPLVAHYGWPFSSASSTAYGTHWDGIFDRQSIKAVSKLAWQRKDLPLSTTRFHPLSVERIHLLIDQNHRGLQTPLANMANTKVRFDKCREWIERTKTLPAPVVLMRDLSGSFRLLDGNHRIAALISLSPPAGFCFSAWVGSSQ